MALTGGQPAELSAPWAETWSSRNGNNPGRRRRLGVRALARHVLSEKSAAVARARICQPSGDVDRDHRHLLRRAETGELPPLARGDAGRLRVLAQGAAVRHASARAFR